MEHGPQFSHELFNKIEKRIPINTAEPPPEIKQIIAQQNLPEEAIEGWLAVPTLRNNNKRISREKLEETKVDAYRLLEPFLGRVELDGSLRMVDALNGCGRNCDTCLADAALPSNMFDTDSFTKLFSDERFIKMLQPDSIRFGSAGDVFDHPDAVKITQMVLEKTAGLDLERQAKKSKHHLVKIMTNYRPNNEEMLDEMIDLAQRFPDRLDFNISTPLNAKDTVNERFDAYTLARPEIFKSRSTNTKDKHGLLDHGYATQIPNITISDIRHEHIHTMGRLLDDDLFEDQTGHKPSYYRDREYEYRTRGFSKIYLNPDALWFMVYATSIESHTNRVFTPLSPQNLNALAHAPFHSDFPTPPHWPGGMGFMKSEEEAKRLIRENSIVDKKKLTIIKKNN